MDAIINFGKVTVSQGYDENATSIVLAEGAGARLPDPSSAGQFNLIWWNSTDYPDPADDPNREIVRCTARSTDTLTVVRNQEGSGASTKNTADKTYRMILGLTKKVMDDMLATASIANSATPAPTGGSKENEYYVTALEEEATFAAPSGTPANGNTLVIRIKDNGTARVLNWNAIYAGTYGTALPDTTVLGKTMYLGFVYNTANSKWELLSKVDEA